MGYYIVLIISCILPPLFISTFSGNIYQKRKITVFSTFIVLWLFFIFEDGSTMADTREYIYDFFDFSRSSLQNAIDGNHSEVGFVLLNKFLFVFSDNEFILLFTCGTIIVWSFAFSVYKYSTMIWLSAFLFLNVTYLQSLYVLRQYIAISICLLSISFVLNRKLLPFLALIFLAFTFHKTAIIFLPVYFLYKLNINFKFFIVSIIIGYIYYSYGFSLIESFLVFSEFGYAAYMDLFSNATAIFIDAFILVLFLVAFDFKQLMGPSKLFFIMFTIGTIIDIGSLNAPGGSRLSMYYNISTIFLIPIAISKLDNYSIDGNMISSNFYRLKSFGTIILTFAIIVCYILKTVQSGIWTTGSLGKFSLIFF